jgi:protease IV
MKTVGVKVEEIKSSPLKAAPNPFEPATPEARAAIESIVMDSYDWFKGLVRDNRKLEGEALTRVTDGRVFTGRQAIDLKLIDELGDEKQAVAWLAKEKGIDPKTRVRKYELEPRFGDLPFLHVAAAMALDAVGLKSWAKQIETWGSVRAIEKLNLDGLLALWHPSVN